MKNISFISIGFINNHFFGWDNNSNKTEEEIINYLKNLDYSQMIITKKDILSEYPFFYVANRSLVIVNSVN